MNAPSAPSITGRARTAGPRCLRRLAGHRPHRPAHPPVTARQRRCPHTVVVLEFAATVRVSVDSDADVLTGTAGPAVVRVTQAAVGEDLGPLRSAACGDCGRVLPGGHAAVVAAVADAGDGADYPDPTWA